MSPLSPAHGSTAVIDSKTFEQNRGANCAAEWPTDYRGGSEHVGVRASNCNPRPGCPPTTLPRRRNPNAASSAWEGRFPSQVVGRGFLSSRESLDSSLPLSYGLPTTRASPQRNSCSRRAPPLQTQVGRDKSNHTLTSLARAHRQPNAKGDRALPYPAAGPRPDGLERISLL